ncbi:MAG TPA: FAD-dependent monooxygenase, partial [Bradyrhizobium sp.]|nr:FAD-dependent monooxygenase [Bradyrhizobium sp.]
MSTSKKVVVVGAGIGGLTAALALLKRGIDVEVYEQSDQLKEVGAGIQISSNGTRVLFALGLETALANVQVRPERRELRHWSTGETWNWFDLGDKSIERFGTPHLMLHRADLHGLLADAVRSLKPRAIRLNKRCVSVVSHAGHVEATFEDGGTVKAPYLIGADGIHSKVRVCLFGPSKPIFTACIAWRGLIPMEKLPPRLARMVGTNWLGPRGNVLHYPVRRGEIMNFVSTSERDDWQVESWSTVGTKEELRNDFRDWHADVQ